MSSIVTGLSDIVYEKAVRPQLSNYMGQIFEQICTQYIIRENAKLSLPFVFGRIGRWWGNNPNKKQQEEIDILAVDEDSAIYGEYKWKNELIGIGILDGLIEKSEIINKYKDKYYMLFSKSGFTKELEETAAKMSNVELVGLKKLY